MLSEAWNRKKKKSPLNLAGFLAFIIQLSKGDKYDFQGRIVGYFLMGKQLTACVCTNGEKYKFININLGEKKSCNK